MFAITATLILVLVLAVALLVLVVTVVFAAGKALAKAPYQLLSDPHRNAMAIIGLLTGAFAIVLAINFGLPWPLLPLGIWIIIYNAMRDRAKTRPAPAGRPSEVATHRRNGEGPGG